MGLLVPKGEDPEEKSKKLDPPGPIRLALKIWVLEKPVLTCLHIFLPFAIYNMHVMKDNDAKSEAITFLTCLLAVVPLAERLGYAPEHAVAILMAWNGQLDASIGISVGSAAQLAIFLVPFAILADWVAGGYIGFGMEPILAAGLAISALFAAILLSSGKCTWMHGVLLITTYAAIIGAFWLSASIGQKEAFSDSTVAWVIDLLKSATTSVRNKASQEALLAAHIHNASVKVHSATDVDAHDAHWVQSAMFIPGTIHAALRAQHAMQATS